MLNLTDIKDGQVRGSQSPRRQRQLFAGVQHLGAEPQSAAPHRRERRRQMLDPAVPLLNPFLHDRQNTFQPRDLWEWLLEVRHHPLHGGRRRAAHPDRPRRMAARPAQSCAAGFSSGRACRARRRPRNPWPLCWPAATRSAPQQTAPALEPNPDLFRPQQPVTLELPGHEAPAAQPKGPDVPATEPAKPSAEAPASTASRLLEAKRRAKRRRK